MMVSKVNHPQMAELFRGYRPKTFPWLPCVRVVPNLAMVFHTASDLTVTWDDIVKTFEITDFPSFGSPVNVFIKDIDVDTVDDLLRVSGQIYHRGLHSFHRTPNFP